MILMKDHFAEAHTKEVSGVGGGGGGGEGGGAIGQPLLQYQLLYFHRLTPYSATLKQYSPLLFICTSIYFNYRNNRWLARSIMSFRCCNQYAIIQLSSGPSEDREGTGLYADIKSQ